MLTWELDAFVRVELGITDSSAKPFALAVLAAATNNFTKEIGRGGFGPVYHGTLPDGKEMAVKVADESTRQGEHEFVNEVWIFTTIYLQLLNLKNLQNPRTVLAFEPTGFCWVEYMAFIVHYLIFIN